MSTLQPRITITIDQDRLQDTPPGAVVVENLADYAPACRDIRDAVEQGGALAVWVHHRTAAAWLSGFAAHYGEGVQVRRHTPRAELAERWQTTIPDAVTDSEIIESGLLAESLSAQPGQSFDDVLLQHYFSHELLAPSLSAQRLDVLLNDYEAEKWALSLRYSLAARALHKRLEQWQGAAGNAGLRRIVKRLREEPEKLKHDLANLKVLRNYPAELRKKVLGQRGEALFKARAGTDALLISDEDVAEAAPEIDYYLSSIKDTITDEAKVLSLLKEMSGYLKREFYFVDELLKENPDWISSRVLEEIETRFAPLAGGLRHSFNALRQLIKPELPTPPDRNWPAKEWLRWVKDEYIPYYAWLELQNKTDAVLAEYSQHFADWFYENFSALRHSRPQEFEFSALHFERERISDRDVVSLVLLIDNFNLVHFDELCRRFNAHGLVLERAEPKFSLIPTATEVGKAALITMRSEQVEHSSERYPVLVREGWSGLLKGRTAGYLSKIGELQNLRELEHALFFLNFLPIDEALHKDASQTGQAHTEAIADALETLAKTVAEFAQRFHIKDRLNVYIMSDHGSTRIAKTTVNILDKSFYKGVAMDKHHRYLALDDEKFRQLPPVADAQCYRIDRQVFGTRKNYLAARGYYRFLDTADTFFVHGGLTPEEVVVPFARFSFTPLEPLPPTIRLLHNEFRYAVKSKVALEIGNPNGFDLTNIRLQLADAEDEEVLLPRLGSRQLAEAVELTTVFRKAAGAPGGNLSRPLTIRASYTCQGRSFGPVDTTFEITLKTMMEVIDDGFDF